MLRTLAFLFCFATTSMLSAQTIYEPLEYEYRVGGTLYFYDGDNPLVHAAAAEPHRSGAAWGRQNGFAFSSSATSVGREVETERIRVFSDGWRYGLQDAGIVGMTITDVRNAAYASVPRYFHKAQLLRNATIADGVRIVAARSGGVTIRKSSGATIHVDPRPLMVFPKPDAQRPQSPILRASVD